jgi:hypothetical protein
MNKAHEVIDSLAVVATRDTLYKLGPRGASRGSVSDDVLSMEMLNFGTETFIQIITCPQSKAESHVRYYSLRNDIRYLEFKNSTDIEVGESSDRINRVLDKIFGRLFKELDDIWGDGYSESFSSGLVEGYCKKCNQVTQICLDANSSPNHVCSRCYFTMSSKG